MIRPAATAIVLAATSAPAGAFAQNLPSEAKSVVFLNVVSTRGAACGLLSPWQAATISSIAGQATLGWDEARREQVERETEARLAQTACDDPGVNVWIEGAKPNLEGEYLSLFLVAYRALLEMPDPPALFTGARSRQSALADSAAIAIKLAELEAAGAVPDGGGPWPQFIAKTSAAVREVAAAVEAGETGRRAEEGRLLIPHVVRITELWLAEQAGGGA